MSVSVVVKWGVYAVRCFPMHEPLCFQLLLCCRAGLTRMWSVREEGA